MKSLKTIIVLFIALQFCLNVYAQTSFNSSSLISNQDLLNKSKNASKEKVKAVFSFGAGTAFLSNKGSAPVNDFKPKSSFQLSALVPLGKWAGLRLDMGYSNWERDAYEESDQVITNSYGARKRDCFYLKPDFVAGDFTSTNKFWFYLSAGFGMNFLKDGAYLFESTNWDGYTKSYNYPAETDGGSVVSLGCAFGYRFTKHLGLYSDTQLNLVAENGFSFFGTKASYMPVKAGLTYTIY